MPEKFRDFRETGPRTGFEKEAAKGNSEMANYEHSPLPENDLPISFLI